jgi:acetoin utilization protein AcuB
MLVSKIMKRNPIVVQEDVSVIDARELMKREKIQRLPVVNKKNKLVGIITEKDILYASPSPASSLSVYEMTALLAKLTVAKVMTKNPFTVQEDTPVEEAVRLQVEKDIAGLPVLKGDVLVGIITKSDVYAMLTDLFGTRKKGVQLTFEAESKPGELSKLTTRLADAGKNIISIGTFSGDDVETGTIVIKVDGSDADEIKKLLSDIDIKELRVI